MSVCNRKSSILVWPLLAVALMTNMPARADNLDASEASPADYPSVWQCDNPKFNWYCSPEELAKLRAEKERKAQAKSEEIDITKLKTSEEVRKALETLKDRAVMEPTEKNLKTYLAAQQYVFDKGSTFADVWRRVVWGDPDLDYTLRRPVNGSAIRTYDYSTQQKQASYLKELAKEHGLIFFFRSDDPYSIQMGPTLKLLQRQYGIEVLPVSLDGKGIAEFPNPRRNQKQATALQVKQTPALFIASRKSGELAPVGYGVMSNAEIVDRIFVLTNTKPGENF